MGIGKRLGDALLSSPARSRAAWSKLNTAALHGMGYGSATRSSADSGDRFGLKLAAQMMGGAQPVTVLDIGAHTGEFAREALATFGPRCRVWCFEPAPDAFVVLEKGMGNDARVRCIQAAVGANSGRSTLYSPEGHPEAASLLGTALDLRSTQTDVAVIDVSSFAANIGLERIDYLKLDIEGAEYAALCGAQDMLADGRVVFVQFEFGNRSADARTFLRDFYELLGPEYVICRLTSNSAISMEPYRPEYEVFVSATNYLAIPTAFGRVMDNGLIPRTWAPRC